jgi:hypothetical protein
MDAGQVHAQGLGPGGSIVLRASPDEVAVTAITGPDQTTRILSGAPDGVAMEHAEDQVRVDGTLTDLGTGQEVAVRLDIDC